MRSAAIHQDLSRFRVPPGFRGKSALLVQMWWLVDATLFRWSPQILYGWRRWLLRLFGAEVGRGALIRSSARITYPWKLRIGDHSWVGDETVIYNLGDIHIGANVAIAHRVYLCAGSHDYRDLSFPIVARSIVVEDEVWLANDVFVGPGCRIGRGAVVGARSSVFADLAGAMICYGNPAKAVTPRTQPGLTP
ncbi:MAG: putative colanic acid biosynthesis acetyltransferase [Gemmatimonadaceae bacterium]